MTLALQVRKSGSSGGWTEVTKQVTSLGMFSNQCSDCTDKNLQAVITPNNPTIYAGTSINLTASGSVNSPFVLNITSYKWTWSGGSSTNKTISITPSQTTTYNLKIVDSQGCEATTSVTVNVETPCQDVTFNTFSWDLTEACPGDPVQLTYDVGTNVGYTIYVNGNAISTTGNSGTYNTVMITGMPLIAKIEAQYASGCDLTVRNESVALSSSSTCCTLPDSLNVDVDTFTLNGTYSAYPGESITVTPIPNGDDTGYTYTWYDAEVGGSSLGTSAPGNSFTITQPTSLTSAPSEGVYNVDYAGFRVEATKFGCPTRTKTFRLYNRNSGIINGFSIPANGLGVAANFCMSGTSNSYYTMANVASVDSYVVEVDSFNSGDLSGSVTLANTCLGGSCTGKCGWFRILSPSFNIPGYSGGYTALKVTATVTMNNGYQFTGSYTKISN